jgi:hypothetical protein
MPETAQISDDALRGALQELEKLAKDEYGATLNGLFADDQPVPDSEDQSRNIRDSHDAFWRVGRLAGITVKEPFATARKRQPKEESQTGARRVWNLNGAALASEHPDWWQYRLIAGFLATDNPTGDIEDFDWLPPKNLSEVEQIAWFLRETHTERGVYRALARGARKYLCRNPTVEAALVRSGASATQAGSATGVTREQQPPEELPTGTGRVTVDPVQAAGQLAAEGVATVIVSAIPWLDPSMVSFVAVLLLMIAAKGLHVFCSRPVPSPVSTVVET